MATSILIEDQLEIPAITGLADFRRWALSDNFPETGRIDYVGGHIEVDMSPEDLHTHGTAKVELVVVVGTRVRAKQLGELYTDRARISCPEADLSAEPDIVFVSNETYESGRVQLIAKASGGSDRYIEMEGAPDLIVEIISDSSVRKDTARLPNAYWQAGVSCIAAKRRFEVLIPILGPRVGVTKGKPKRRNRNLIPTLFEGKAGLAAI